MRPARKGPENVVRDLTSMSERAGFNEAGPQGAGKRRRRAVAEPHLAHASMRPARKGPENGRSWPATAVAGHASMRPARKGPENVVARHQCRAQQLRVRAKINP